ncbi:MAG TPA: helix-turn-helix domain-containing protein [Cytophagales bacterium]|nr:helix-turn-helix domain-containing protein [Cytophagales bacterium]
MIIRTHIPVSSSHISDYVISIWEVYGDRKIKEAILPQGVVELVFNLGDGMTGILPGDKVVKTPSCFIQGLNTNVINVEYTGQQHLFGIRLQPPMLKSLLGITPAELKNSLIDLTLIKKHFLYLWHQLVEVRSFEERVTVIETEFPLIKKSDCVRTQKLCNMFFSNSIEGFESVELLAESVNYSTRQVNRKAHSLFGVSGEELTAYKKFLQSVKLIHTANYSLTEIAHASGFYDQAHFCRIFKMYSGITATEYNTSKGHSPFHLFL